MNENLKWNVLKEKAQQASEMKPSDNVYGIKTVNISESMMVYEISHTLGNQSEYVAAYSPAEAIEKLKETYISDKFSNRRINDEDIISVVKLGDLIL